MVWSDTFPKALKKVIQFRWQPLLAGRRFVRPFPNEGQGGLPETAVLLWLGVGAAMKVQNLHLYSLTKFAATAD